MSSFMLRAKGLVTYRDELTVPEGAMDVADNIVIDEDDVIEIRRGQNDYGTELPTSTDRLKQIAEYKNLLIRHFNNTIQFDDGNGAFTSFSGSYQELEAGLRIKYLEANGNFYFTDITGIKKISAKNSTQINSESIQSAGVPRAVSVSASLLFTDGGFLPPQSKLAYRVLWGKKDNNGNLLLGYPSERFVLTNTSDTIEINESFTVDVRQVPTNDDVLLFSNSTTDYYIWFETVLGEEAPDTSKTLGRTPVKVSILASSAPTEITTASKIANAIAALSGFEVSVQNTTVTVTLTEGGDVADASAYTGETLSDIVLKVTPLVQGQITQGTSSNATVSFSVPAGIDESYFYQIYRTAPVTVPQGLTIDDIDPGDEMNLAVEGNPLDSNGNLLTEVTVEDITPEDFRAAAVFLYTNPISGEGILQANAIPPVAKDITLFNGSNFYANTKTTHKFSLNMVSTLNLTSGVSDFVIGNEDSTVRFTAVGTTQSEDLTINTGNLEGKYFFVNSARDERAYYVWYDFNGTTTPPTGVEFVNKIPVRVTLTSTLTDTINANSDVADGTEEITLPNHGLEQDEEVIVNLLTGDLPTGLTDGNVYTVNVIDANTIRLFENGILVDLTSQTGTFNLQVLESIDTIVEKTAADLASTNDFSIVTLSNTLTISSVRNGVTTPISLNGFTTEFTTSNLVLGTGEDLLNNQFLLSSFISVAASIDETARSLVKVINANQDSPVNAYYLSGAEDVPGIMLFESRNLEDKPFYVTSSDSNILADFDPTLNLEIPVQSTEINSINSQQTDLILSQVTSSYFIGQEIFIYDDIDTLPFPSGKYIIKNIVSNTITIDAVSVTNTSGIGYVVVALNESDNEESPNRMYFSKAFQPESVPLVNFIDIGPKDKQILRILPLRDNLFALKEDGVYIISGSSAPNFTVRLLDSSVSLTAPDSAVVLNNAIYALSSDGVVRISDTGVQVISRPIEDLIKKVTNTRYQFKTTSFGISYDSDRSYLVWLPERTTDTVAAQAFRYNTFTNTWTRFTISATCGLVANSDDKMYLGEGSRNVMTQERKMGDRTDYSDRDFLRSIISDGINSNSVKISSVLDVEEGDVIYQSQYVTLSVLKRLLRKLDIDKLVTSTNYFETIPTNFGINVANTIESIISKLLADGINIPNAQLEVISQDPITQGDQFNILIEDLNADISGTSLKDYKPVTDLVPYEMVISKVNIINNSLELVYETPFVEGDILVYKGIKSEFQYAPQHFGDPTSLKQIRQGSIIFDQNSFYGGTISYASDQSADFIATPFSGYGIGDWGTGSWGEGTWGGSGNDIPYRTLIPLEKQRCRYLTVKISHQTAREIVRINGISLLVRSLSNRAYR